MTDRARHMVLLVGHPRPGSRTHAVTARAGVLLRRALAAETVTMPPPTTVDLAELAPHLLDRHRVGGPAQAAIGAVRGADLMIAASPTFRGTYSGLLKFFLDLLPRDGLGATVVLPLATAGLPGHRGAVDATLRPVLRELRGHVPAAGICVLESELAGFDDLFRVWWGEHGAAVVGALRIRSAERGSDHVEWNGAVAS